MADALHSMSDHLDLKKTYRTILEAARDKRFINYSYLASANNAVWNKVRFEMRAHLFELVKIAAAQGWPMPTAIVVDKNNIEAGILDGNARNGFISAAKEVGFDIGDPLDITSAVLIPRIQQLHPCGDEILDIASHYRHPMNQSRSRYQRIPV